MAISSFISDKYILRSSESVLKTSHIYVDTIMGINVILKVTLMMKMP